MINPGYFSQIGCWGLAATLLGLAAVPVWAAPPVNTINDGRIVKGNNYYNTPDGKTTFINSGPGGLWVRKNVAVRGLEVDAAGKLTNHGGTMHFIAPDSVVRVDGKIDVSGVLNNQGATLGNGGRIMIDAAYLYQSGRIYANGINGGLVQFNVGSAVFAPGAEVYAKGFGGNGGIVAVHTDGIVDVARGASISTIGKMPAGTGEANLINLEGGVVRNSGILRADGVVVNPGADGTRGGTIRLIASGNTHLDMVNTALNNARKTSAHDSDSTPTFTKAQANALKDAAAKIVRNSDGNIVIYGHAANGAFTPARLSANGSSGARATTNDTVEDSAARAGDGGNIILSTMNHVVNYGLIAANGGSAAADKQIQGGNGGAIAIISNGGILNGALPSLKHQGVISANGGTGSGGSTRGGSGGQGGLIALGYNTQATNRGIIQAKGGVGGSGQLAIAGNGGRGGMIVLSGDGNPTGRGILDARDGDGGIGKLFGMAGGKSGIIISPNPGGLLATQNARQADGNTRMLNGQILIAGKSAPLTEQTRQNELLTHHDTLILLSRNTGKPLTGNLAERTESIRSVGDPHDTGLARQQIVSRDDFSSGFPHRHLVIGSSADQQNVELRRSPPYAFIWSDNNGEEHDISLFRLKTSTLVNDGRVDAFNPWDAGSSIAILSSGDIYSGEGGFVADRSVYLASKGLIHNTNVIEANNVIIKAEQDLINGYDHFIHGGNLNSKNIYSGTVRLISNHDVFNNGSTTTGEIGFNDNPTYGGNIYILASNRITHGAEDEFFRPEITARAVSAPTDIGGYIRLQAPDVEIKPSNVLDVSGALKNGRIEILRGPIAVP